MNTQPGIQQVFPWVNGFQAPLTSLMAPDPPPSWDERSNEAHPEAIGLKTLAIYRVKP